MTEKEIIYIVLYCVVSVYLILMSIIDIRKKEIPLIPGAVLLGIIITVLLICRADPVSFIGGMGIGALLYLISRLSRGSVGEADALVYLITGCTLGFWKNSELLLISLVLCSIVGGSLLVLKKVTGKTKLAFIPFTATGYIIVLGSNFL